MRIARLAASSVALVSCLACLPFSVGCGAGGDDDANGSESDVTAATSTKVTDASVSTIARHGDDIFWTDFTAIEVRKVSLGGGASTVLWKGRTSPMDQLGDIEADATDVFFVEDGRILRVPQAGGKATELVRLAKDFPSDITLDDTHVYWSSAEYGSVVIRRVPKAGGAIEDVYQGPTGGDGLVQSGGYLYFYGVARPASDGAPVHVVRVGTTPGSSLEEIALFEGSVTGIAVDDTNVYVAAKSGAWSIQSVPLAGGKTTALATLTASNDDTPRFLSLADGKLSWARSQTFDWSQNPPGQHDGKILRVSTAGGAVKELATGLDGASALVSQDGSCPVWGGRYAIETVARCK